MSRAYAITINITRQLTASTDYFARPFRAKLLRQYKNDYFSSKPANKSLDNDSDPFGIIWTNMLGSQAFYFVFLNWLQLHLMLDHIDFLDCK